MERNEMPVGFAMSLAMNQGAMEKFALLSENKKQEIIAKTQTIKSRDEMRQFVASLANDSHE